MLLLMLVQVFVRGASMIKSNMRLHVRLRFWVGLASAYVLFMGFVHLLQVPLRSNALHSHYDLSGEGVFAKHRAAVKKEAEKYAQAALKAPAADMETAQQISLLKETFKKADSSVDGLLDLAELSSWISTKIKEHLTLALKENFFMFTAIDQDPRNGMVSWDEFHHYFLKQHGYDDKYIQEHKKNHKGMPRELKDKAAWSEAARDNPEHLTIDEFLAFRHPESSHATILSIVEETIGRLDMNEVPDDMTLEQYKNERLKEFRIADEDSNGKVDRRELLRYIDPRNIHHAEKEAVNLLSAADTNQDGVLTLVEVLAQREMFMRSKMVDAAKSFHDEF
ncbi:45 kDa calcium-binding protein-like [Homarus americanus]|uniref:45 kDa calcium-binding protein-like n=1 Tax=Homarus americanus TaxID=6706 RepID=A0A8J5J612_HOMAM|nr:45 kDa calcium-binding protein-like [Homarus americanus]